MHYVYVLCSKQDKRLYVGCSKDLRARLERHNSGYVRSTKYYRPWVLVYYEAYRVKRDATRRERQLKMHAVKNDFKKQIQESLRI